MSLVELLNPQKNEHILDLGCGYGELTKEIADKRVARRVVGIDNKNSYLEWKKVKLEWKKVKSDSSINLKFQKREATNLKFKEKFDAVFSHLVIHHIKPPEEVISSVWNALKPGGRFVVEFYGYGTAEEIILALQKVMSSHNYSFDIKKDFPWYLPTQEEYCKLLTSQGFEVTDDDQSSFAEERLIYGNISGWLQDIGFNPESLSSINKKAIFDKVHNEVHDQLCRNYECFVNYQHIRIVAIKSSELSNNN